MGIVLKPILLNADQKKVIQLKHKIKYFSLERNRHFVESSEPVLVQKSIQSKGIAKALRVHHSGIKKSTQYGESPIPKGGCLFFIF